MNLRILCLDDQLETLHEPLKAIFRSMITKGAIPYLNGGISEQFTINRLDNEPISIEISSNSQNIPEKVIEEIETVFSEQKFDIVLIDDQWGASAPNGGQLQLLPVAISKLSGECPELPVFVLYTQHWEQIDRVNMFCDLMNRYPKDQHRVTGLHKSDTSGMMLLIQRVVTEKRIAEDRQRLAEENRCLKQQNEKACPRPEAMIGESDAMRKVYTTISVVAPVCSTVIIGGESGTGKELVARAIHLSSNRNSQPMISLNCGAIPETLLESELFGHEKGAFTGATRRQKGKFELAQGGTIFLDEIGDMSPALQVKVLRVIQERQFERIGGTVTINCDVRIIVATNQDLKIAVAEKRFREDLYHRINVIPIILPPLRDRRDDIPELVNHFVTKNSTKLNKEKPKVSEVAMQWLKSYSWPGNIRELENCIERGVLLCQSSEIEIEHLSLDSSTEGNQHINCNLLASESTDVNNRDGDVVRLFPNEKITQSSKSKEVPIRHVEVEILYPRTGVIKADFEKVKEYLNKCLKLVKEKPESLKLSLKAFEEENNLNTNFFLKAYLNKNYDDIVLVVKENIHALRPILPILRRCRKVSEGLTKVGINE